MESQPTPPPPAMPPTPPVPPTPPRPARWRTAWWVVAAAVVVAITGSAVAVAVAGGGNSDPAAGAVVGGSDPAAQPAPDVSRTYAPQHPDGVPVTADGPDRVTKRVGQTISIIETSFGDTSEIDYTVTKVASPAGLLDPYEDPPAKDMLVVVSVTERVVTGTTYACDCDFQLVATDGTTYDPTWSDGGLSGVDLQSGQKVSGRVAFDVPKAKIHQYHVHLDLDSDDVDANWQL